MGQQPHGLRSSCRRDLDFSFLDRHQRAQRPHGLLRGIVAFRIVSADGLADLSWRDRRAGRSPLSASNLAETRGVSEHLMRKIKRFAGAYTPRDFDALCNARRPNGLPLQWGHVNYLLTIHDKQPRRAMQRRAIANGWTAPQLARVIRKSHQRKPGHGRPVVPPSTPELGLEQLTADAVMWIRRCEAVMAAVQPGPEKRLKRELRQRAKEAVEVLEGMQQAVRRAKRKLGAMLSGWSVG